MAELTPKQVAAMREFAIHDPVKREDDVRAWVVELCDELADLRKRLNNLRHEQNRWVESDQAAMRREKKALQDVAELREQLQDETMDRRHWRDAATYANGLVDEQADQIRRLTAVLREYGQHKYDCPEVYFTVVSKLCNCGFARALTEMEGEDG